MFFNRLTYLLLLLFISLQFEVSLAHQGHEDSNNKSHQLQPPHSRDHKPNNFRTAPKTDEEAISRVLDIFHFAIDGTHEHSHLEDKDQTPFYLKMIQPQSYTKLASALVSTSKSLAKSSTWRQIYRNANLRRVFDDALKAYNIESQHKINKEHVNNLILILPISHALEMFSGPAFMSLAHNLDLPLFITAGVGSVLSISAIPGLDWLCIIIASNYASPFVHRPLSFIRHVHSLVAKNIIKTLSIDSLVRKNFEVEISSQIVINFQREFNKAVKFENLLIKVDSRQKIHELIFYHEEQSPFLTLKLKSNQSNTEWTPQLSLTQIQVDTKDPSSTHILKAFAKYISPYGKFTWFSQVGYNLSQLASLVESNEILKLENMAEENFYVTKSERLANNFLNIEFEERAIRLPIRYRLRKLCKSLFN